MNKDQIRHKCGYCGWLFSFTTNFVEHECFKDYVEDEDCINIDENYVVTICNAKTAEGPASKDNLDELLIGAVKVRKGLYDYSIPASKRSNLHKNALWAEVSNTLGGALSPEEVKIRWKYLRDNYTKARKKAKGYIPSGSAAQAANILKKPKFRFYDLMTFLNDCFETRQTVSSLPDDVAESEIYRTSEQHETDTLASASRCTNISPWTPTTIHAPLPMETPTLISQRTATPTVVPLRTSTLNNVPPRTPPALSMTSRIPVTNSRKALQTANYNLDVPRQTPAAKKQKSDPLQTALIEALRDNNAGC